MELAIYRTHVYLVRRNHGDVVTFSFQYNGHLKDITAIFVIFLTVLYSPNSESNLGFVIQRHPVYHLLRDPRPTPMVSLTFDRK